MCYIEINGLDALFKGRFFKINTIYPFYSSFITVTFLCDEPVYNHAIIL